MRHQGDASEEYTVTALGMLHRGKVPYLVARLHEANEPKHSMDRIRQVPVSRIKAVRATLFNEPQVCNFDFDEYLRSNAASFQIGKPFRLELEIFDSVRREIEDAHLGENQEITPIPGQNKNWQLSVDVEYSQNLIHWLFGRAPYLKVVGPKPFRDMFYRDLENALNHGSNNQIEIVPERTFQPFSE
jgi:predicted DNA-binding transcriptional regulator YafY